MLSIVVLIICALNRALSEEVAQGKVYYGGFGKVKTIILQSSAGLRVCGLNGDTSERQRSEQRQSANF